MVIDPPSYTFQHLDFDLLLSNLDNLTAHYNRLKSTSAKKKSKAGINAEPPKEIKVSVDIASARKIAEALQNGLKLSQHVQHFPSKDPSGEDFIFIGSSFYDPLETVNWNRALPKKAGKVVLVLPKSQQGVRELQAESSKPGLQAQIRGGRELSSELSSLGE